MYSDFHLVAIVKKHRRVVPFGVPLHHSVEYDWKENWISKYRSFVRGFDEVDFKAGYQLRAHECFRFVEYDLPIWFTNLNTQTVMSIEEISSDVETHNSIQGMALVTRNDYDDELVLFQDFSRSMAVNPGRLLLSDGNTYKYTEYSGVLLNQNLCAVYMRHERKLLFRDFRSVNSFLPISDFYKKRSEQEIREILQHDLFATENLEYWVNKASYWFRNRLTLLKDSGVLDRYSAKEIESKAKGFGVPIQIVNGKILLPSDANTARKLLRFLNEEYFRGAITGKVYTTNVKQARRLNTDSRGNID